MSRGSARTIEATICAGASAIFAGSLALAVFTALDGRPGSVPAAAAAGAAVAGFLLSWGLLGRVDGKEADFAMPLFAAGAIQPQAEPLELTEVYQEPLELRDILEQVGPGARVVRLFDPSAMPSPGELKARIDRHLDRGLPPAASPDASQALVDALTRLRQSLR